MKRKNFEFPTAYTVLFLILILVTVLTHIIPAGKYDRLSYQENTNEFVVEKYGNENITLKATQENLDKLDIKIDVNKFIDGTIKKPMAIPNTYVKLDGKSQGLDELIEAPISGIAESIDIIIFVLVLGGIVGIVNKTGTFNIAMKAISQKTKGKEFSLVIISFIFFAAGGTIFGFWEETIPVYTIASNAAGISFNEGLKFRFVALIVFSIISLLYIYRYIKRVKENSNNSFVIEEQKEIREKFLKDYSQENDVKFNWRTKIILFLFLFQFVIMIWGVSSLGWWFQEVAAMFFGVSIIIMLISGLSEKEGVNGFITGTSEVVGVALIIGLARAINIIMENGMISDTLLFYSSNVVAEMGKGLFAIVMLFVFAFLGIFIPSTSGLAVLSMPILSPLADTVGLSRAVVVDAFTWGQGIILFITPTGLIFVVLQIVGIPYNKWLKFVMPLLVIIAVLVIIILYVMSVFFR